LAEQQYTLTTSKRHWHEGGRRRRCSLTTAATPRACAPSSGPSPGLPLACAPCLNLHKTKNILIPRPHSSPLDPVPCSAADWSRAAAACAPPDAKARSNSFNHVARTAGARSGSFL